MKKVIWMTNLMLPIISEDKKLPPNNYGGWITGLLNEFKKIEDVELFILCPTNNHKYEGFGSVDNIEYYCFYESNRDVLKYSFILESKFREVIDRVNPSLIHIFGTEYPHTLALIKAFNNPKRTVINIQGIVSIYAQHYFANLPFNVIYKFGLKEIIKMKNIDMQKKDFVKRGAIEIQAIKEVAHVIGRTEWDEACTNQINANIDYHFCNETLRDVFYLNSWDYSNCEKYSIFISQANYPIKGFHIFLDALIILIKKYPQIKVYVAGIEKRNENKFHKIKMSSYEKFVLKIIKENNLENNIIYTGNLNDKQMCERYLKSNVFVSPSAIENSPNSVGEAMILGVPVIVTDVGGIRSQLNHGVEGFLYPFNEPYMLAYYIEKLFNDSKTMQNISANARTRANLTYNREHNLRRMLEIYDSILNS